MKNTGIKDKNNKMIQDNDFLKITFGSGTVWEGVVEWNPRMAAFGLNTYGQDGDVSLKPLVGTGAILEVIDHRRGWRWLKRFL